MDELFRELLEVNSDSAFNFFLTGLREVTRREPGDEMFYVASVLAHYAQTSRYDPSSLPPLANLSEVFDQFFFLDIPDSEILEIGGSQILLFAGFFRDQMRRRHNLDWYDEMGKSFYERASMHSKERKKRRLFENLSESFPIWTRGCCDLSRRCREDGDGRYLLKFN